MKPALLAAALAIASIGSAAEEPEMLPPWIVAAPPARPDDRPVRATALLAAESWSDRGVATLPDAFRLIPGAMMQESFGGFEPPRLSIRGSGVQSAPSSRGVALLLNALPLGLADGSFNSALVDPLLSDHVEVQRGLDGWRASPAAAGGALDFRNRAGGGGVPAAVRIEAGSFGAWRARARESAEHGATTAEAAASFARQRGFREQSGQARTAFLGQIDRRFENATQGQAQIYHAHARYEVPGPLTLATATLAPRSISSDARRDRPARVAEITRLATSFAHHSQDAELQLAASLARMDDDFRQLQANGVTRSRSDDAHLRFAASRRFGSGAVAHRGQIAATASRGWRDQRRFANAAGSTGALFARDGLYPTTTTLSIEDTVALGSRVVATAGVARIDARREIADRLRVAPLSTQQFGDGATLPAASARWRLTRDTVLFASVSRVAEPPTFDDLLVISGTPAGLLRRSQQLATQRAVTWEFGARGQTGPVAWDTALYRSAWRDEILRLADANGAARGVVNASPTTHEGVEISARWRIAERPFRVALVATGAWTRIVFDDDPIYQRNRVAGIPPHVGAADLTIETPRGEFFSAGADWTGGATRVDHAGRLAYGGDARGRLRVGRHHARVWTFFVEAKNVFDRRGIASTAGVLDVARSPATTAVFLPSPGRAISAGIEWRH